MRNENAECRNIWKPESAYSFARRRERPGPQSKPCWRTIFTDFVTLPVAETVCLNTYRLRQGERVTRRATLWRLEGGVWRAVYHQGTR